MACMPWNLPCPRLFLMTQISGRSRQLSALFSDGVDDVARNDTADYLDFAPHRRPSVLALQLRLGLLPFRRARPRHHHHSHPIALGKAIAATASLSTSARASRQGRARKAGSGARSYATRSVVSLMSAADAAPAFHNPLRTSLAAASERRDVCTSVARL